MRFPTTRASVIAAGSGRTMTVRPVTRPVSPNLIRSSPCTALPITRALKISACAGGPVPFAGRTSSSV
ncbi:hypothetical protein LUW74_27065 [Actinomadura madurae]|uniref:hypothetical protein n=1 Tax=Actinomadura madurae TaxID=1993 RepID=UPI002027095B|nr:hypothetical protein [Actinomadura madurae]URN06609.1 hypothetical protein LUW74_27065 [Actinomadura madurae]